jgi:hypothetical protein
MQTVPNTQLLDYIICPLLGPDVGKITITLKALMEHPSVPLIKNKVWYWEHDIS